MERSSRIKWITGISSTIAMIALIALMSWLRPGVPKKVTILAGVEGSRSHQWAQRYAEYVEKHGVDASVVTTAGSGEILDRFAEAEKSTVGFLQSGVEREVRDGEAPKGLQSLGSLYFEPIWLFVREDSDIHDIPDLEGKRVFSGRPGSDARAAVRGLLDVYGTVGQRGTAELAQLTPSEAADALLAGDIDGVFLAGESGKGAIHRLLANDSIRAVSAKHADVVTRIQPGVGNLLLPQGLFDLGRMIPREDVRVIAPAINLVADEELHPALVDLFLDAATSIHGRPTLLSKRGEFPSQDYTSLPLNPDAERYYKKGPSGLRKYLPFWLASLIDQLIVYALPVFVVLSSVLKGIPVALDWRTKFLFQNVYRQMQRIENAPDRASKRKEHLKELDALEAACSKIRVPRMNLFDYIELRQHLHDLRERIEQA